MSKVDHTCIKIWSVRWPCRSTSWFLLKEPGGYNTPASHQMQPLFRYSGNWRHQLLENNSPRGEICPSSLLTAGGVCWNSFVQPADKEIYMHMAIHTTIWLYNFCAINFKLIKSISFEDKPEQFFLFVSNHTVNQKEILQSVSMVYGQWKALPAGALREIVRLAIHYIFFVQPVGWTKKNEPILPFTHSMWMGESLTLSLCILIAGRYPREQNTVISVVGYNQWSLCKTSLAIHQNSCRTGQILIHVCSVNEIGWKLLFTLINQWQRCL